MPTRAQKRKPPERTYDLKLTGDLKGFRVVMRAMSARHLIQFKREELEEVQLLELVSEKIVEHDFDVDDLMEMDLGIVMDILAAWVEAQTDAAAPPQNARPSQLPSSQRRQAGRRVSNSLSDTP